LPAAAIAHARCPHSVPATPAIAPDVSCIAGWERELARTCEMHQWMVARNIWPDIL
jgi:hypothetical protein